MHFIAIRRPGANCRPVLRGSLDRAAAAGRRRPAVVSVNACPMSSSVVLSRELTIALVGDSTG